MYVTPRPARAMSITSANLKRHIVNHLPCDGSEWAVRFRTPLRKSGHSSRQPFLSFRPKGLSCQPFVIANEVRNLLFAGTQHHRTQTASVSPRPCSVNLATL